jgi:transposase
MSRQPMPSAITTIGIDIGKNTFHLVGLDQRGAIVLQLKTSREQLERRLINVPPCLIGMEACSGAHHRPTARSLWSRRAPNPGTVCEAVP